MIKINEIFFSIQGETSKAGLPTVFIRTSGCHLRCTYCDTKYAYKEGEFLSVEQIIQKAETYSTRHICVTGGEPLLQKNIYQLLTELCDRGFKLSLETSGDLSCKGIDPRVLKIIDVKISDSGECGKFSEENLQLKDVNSEFKFVICSEKDFYWSEEFIAKNALHESCNVFYSPSFGVIDNKWLAEKILEENSQARLQLQLHKYIWSSEVRGI